MILMIVIPNLNLLASGKNETREQSIKRLANKINLRESLNFVIKKCNLEALLVLTF